MAKRKSSTAANKRQRTTAEANVPARPAPNYGHVLTDAECKALTTEQYAAAVNVQVAVRDILGGNALTLTETMNLITGFLRDDGASARADGITPREALVMFWNFKQAVPIAAPATYRCDECGEQVGSVNSVGLCRDCAAESAAAKASPDGIETDSVEEVGLDDLFKD